jgi:hypothetical protein
MIAIKSADGIERVSIHDVDMGKRINGLLFSEYCNEPEKIAEEMRAAGFVGEEYRHYCCDRQGHLTGKFRVKYKPLHNGHLYAFAKLKFRK